MLLSAFSSASLCSSALKISFESSVSNVDLSSQHLDFFERDEVALSHSWAAALDTFPIGFAGQVRLPEGPRPTLSRSSGVNRAASLLRIKVDAVAVGVLGQRHSTAGRPSIHQTDFPDRLVEKIGNGLNLVLFDPDMTG